MRWRLSLLGTPSLSDGVRQVSLADTGAVALAYVALEGQCSRAVLSALLWPGSPEATARNNLRQLKRRLRLACDGDELLEGEESLQLSGNVVVDALRLRDSVLPSGASEEELLAGLQFDDSPELARWLDGARARVEGWWRKARVAELARREAAGDLAGALALAEAWASREPESEEAGRHLMRLLYLQGQRGAALKVFERLERTLERELGVKPLPETLALARLLEQGTRLPGATAARRPLPMNILRPPVLSGREAEWRVLLEAWEAGQVLVIIGEPGVGKSRLITDFAESRGRWVRCEGRPGDREVPFATTVRSLREWRAVRPDVQLPEWARRELSRLLPELAEPGEALPPVSNEPDRMRLFDAITEMSTRLMGTYDTLVSDDMHYFSEADLALARYTFGRMYPTHGAGLPRCIQGVRKGEGSESLWSLVRSLEDAGVARMVELRPLGPDGVRSLLAGLGLGGAERHAERIARYTGGNPLYVVETVKHLVETGALEGDWPERLPPPGRVGRLIQRRLEALSPAALRLARVAALARTWFSYALASAVLEVGALQVGEAAVELEAAQVMAGERFTHDLVHEAVAVAIPEPLRRMLHVRLGEVLERMKAPPVVVAHHWFEAGDPQRGSEP
ncbi:BTAD domain-containing putative transcriptional regulator [Archangium violaceum]|uniref:AAA family ATPase n=1 Tax=Archangium violaceum TaxID=83451 RepID=UPI002B2E9E61|nr:BTAD domain-containing putative transcriptional regulator [Archangium gephyra]